MQVVREELARQAAQLAGVVEELGVVTRWLYACVGVLVLVLLVVLILGCRRYRPWRLTRHRPARRLEVGVEQRKAVFNEGTARKVVIAEAAAAELDNVY